MPYRDKDKQAEYQRNFQKTYSLRVSKLSEKDLIEFIESKKPVSAYLKQLVRAEMEK